MHTHRDVFMKYVTRTEVSDPGLWFWKKQRRESNWVVMDLGVFRKHWETVCGQENGRQRLDRFTKQWTSLDPAKGGMIRLGFKQGNDTMYGGEV